MADQPLAARMRPRSFEEFVGQSHLVGSGKVLSKLVAGGHLPSIVLWGPAVVDADHAWFTVPAASALVPHVWGAYWAVSLSVRLRDRPLDSPHQVTRHSASSTIARLILDSPRSRSRKVIGTSTTRQPVRQACQARSTWKQ